MVKARKEDLADLWLREHDPYYTDSDKNKRKKGISSLRNSRAGT